jgi:alpha-D-ribose 1-methylphosphonate 5-phosphate C-P lyase
MESKMAKRLSKAEKIAERRIDMAYRASCSGIPIDIMDIGKIFAFGQLKIAEGEDDTALAVSIRAYVETIRR